MAELEELFDPGAVAALLALATATADGQPIGLLDERGQLVAGRSPGPVPGHAQPVAYGPRIVGSVVGSTAVRPELLALVARSLELVLVSTDERAVRERVAGELAIGRRIQLALVPRRYPAVAGWSFAAAYEPAREVGGDLFDAFPLRDQANRFGLLIADVAGKGIPAALMMADVRALLHAATDNASGPGDALQRVNQILVNERSNAQLVTAGLLVVEATSGGVRYAAAGHEPPLVARRGGDIETLEAEGSILGLLSDVQFDVLEARLDPGDAVVLYTDGVTEARDNRRRLYGEGRLLAAVRGACGASADAIVRAVVDDVRAFRGAAEPYDDLAVLVAERRREP